MTLKPKTLFLVDALGALLTAFFLTAMTSFFHGYIGMSQTILTTLAVIAFTFCIYSMSCFVFIKRNWQPFFKAIIISNILYCCATVACIIYSYQQLTFLGVIYFVLEIIVILVLLGIEIKAAGTKESTKNISF
jgi:hypothetical protein